MQPEADYQIFCVECQGVDEAPFWQFADFVPVGSLITIMDQSYQCCHPQKIILVLWVALGGSSSAKCQGWWMMGPHQGQCYTFHIHKYLRAHIT